MTREVRAAQPADDAAVRAVVRDAFDGDAEAILGVLDDLDARGDLVLRLLAEEDGVVAGVICLSRAWLDARKRLVELLVLSPLAVATSHEGRGLGTTLLQSALDAASDGGSPMVFLEGSPDYYGARGFERASAHGVRRPSERIPDAAAQVALLPGHEPWMTGQLLYPDAWWRRDLVGLRDPLLAEIEGRLGDG